MKRTITRLFDNDTQAETAVRELEAAGVLEQDISYIAPSRATGESRSFVTRDADGKGDVAEVAAKGAAAGGAIGAGAGLLAGLGLLAIPGLGPVVAAGWLASMAAGAAAGAVAGGATGGILGALKDAGVDDADAQVYAEGVRRGSLLVSVRVDDAGAARVNEIFDRQSGVDAAARGPIYRQEGRTGFQPDGPGPGAHL